jgi:hypothetical protein
LSRYKTPGPWRESGETVVKDYPYILARITIESGPLEDTRTGQLYEDGARRVRIDTKVSLADDLRTKVFTGETAWSQADNRVRDLANAVKRAFIDGHLDYDEYAIGDLTDPDPEPDPVPVSVDLWNYQWKVPVIDDEGKQRYITPHGDPMQHESAFDFVFATQKEAFASLDDFDVRDEAKAEGWVLVHYEGEIITS